MPQVQSDDENPADSSLEGRLATVRARINEAAARVGRDPAGITLVAVSKTHPPEAVSGVLAAGQSVFGESRVQEAKAKVTTGTDGKPVIAFDIPALSSDAGQLEGLFHCTARGDFWWRDGSSNFRGYTFAVPDKHEAAALAAKSAPEMLWREAFAQMGNSQVESRFADRGTYFFEGTEIDFTPILSNVTPLFSSVPR